MELSSAIVEIYNNYFYIFTGIEQKTKVDIHIIQIMEMKGLDDLTIEGTKLLDMSEPVRAHSSFNRWVSTVMTWLNKNYPNTGLSADWASQGSSDLVTGNGYSNDTYSWQFFKAVVQKRLRWLGQLPTKTVVNKPDQIQEEALGGGRREIKLQITSRAYVDPSRIAELKAIHKGQFDLTKLIRLCEEINICYAGECYLSMAMLTRAILDHIPPILGYNTFKALASEYGNGGKSFKDQMSFLENSSRKIADGFLHTTIRPSEVLPTVTQVDFSNSIDSLLGEIVRTLK